MEPTYHDGDKLIVLFTDRVNENDIVICWSDPLDEYLVKRVIGVPGDVIEIKNGALYRNGNRVYEAYIKDVIWDLESDESITLGDDEFFLLGDNRNDSIDSRNLGAIERDDIFGKVLLNWTKFTSSE
jgi:signal peptidase I